MERSLIGMRWRLRNTRIKPGEFPLISARSICNHPPTATVSPLITHQAAY